MFKAVLFDLDNTLMDFTTMKKMSCEAAISAMIDAGLKMEKEKAYKKLFDLYQIYGIENKEIFQKFLEECVGKVDYKILANGITAYRLVQTGFVEPFPHVRSTLIKLKEKQVKLGVVSDAPKIKAWLRLSEMRLTDFFDVVVTLDDTGKYKPHHMPFKAALELLKLTPQEVLFVGDNPTRDIKGAKEVGMKTALAKYGQVFKSNGVRSDYILNDVADILDIVKNYK